MSIIGEHKVHFTQVDSTNSEAKRLIDDGKAKEGTLITADYQTSGRGQYGRNWNSEPAQNVIMSIVLSPIFLKIKNQFLLNICVSLAVAKVVKAIIGRGSVKWPNDIYVGLSKISGILIQNFIQASTIKNTIVGIGLNVNQREWPSKIKNATSLCLEVDFDGTVSHVVQLICQEMEIYYERLKMSPESMISEYEESLFKKDEVAEFSIREHSFFGKIRGVDGQGRLIIEENGVKTSYLHGEVQYVIK